MNVRAGDTVKIAENATYYNGQSIPGWVKNDTWIVRSVNGDRAVIDKNVEGTSSINSPINVAFLIVKGGGPDPQPSHTIPDNMKISEKGIELIIQYEGCRLTAYKCPAGVWTIGYGHTKGVKEGDCLSSEKEARQLLMKDLEQYCQSVRDCISTRKLIFVPNQNQFDALVSFCYNCGAGNLQKLVSGKTPLQIAQEMLAYNKGGGVILRGLVERRQKEHDLFLS